MTGANRRQLSSRKIPFFQSFAKKLVAWGLTPNQVSVASSLIAVLGGMAFASSPTAEGMAIRILLIVIGSIAIQFRLLCNMIDGLMAIEGGLKTPAGEIFNDFPDRVSDVALIMGAGVMAQQVNPLMLHIGWAASLLAVTTAYVRTLGSSISGKSDFSGPMAKQHRMFFLTLGGLASIGEIIFAVPAYSMGIILVLIALGSLMTVVRRLFRLSSSLQDFKNL